VSSVPNTEHPIRTRMGDGAIVAMTRSQIRADVEAASELAARRAKLDPLAPDEVDHIVDVFSSEAKFTGVALGREVVLSFDGSGNEDFGSPVDQILSYQNHLGADALEVGWIDYSFRAAKTILEFQAQEMREVQQRGVAPCFYGAMPDLGRYSRPDGPIPNWSELMPLGKIDEARAAQEEAIEMLVEDILFVTETMDEAGADGIDFDTSGAAGDADLLGTLKAVEKIHERWPHLGIEVGMASEMTLGMHGELEYDGKRLAGMWPHQQVQVVAAAGATVFGPAVNTNTTKSGAWNVSRAITLMKRCCEESPIPVHANVGMGVGGVPMSPYPPADAVARASKCLVEVLRLDGL
jgi:dimethylamine---corrinoid protein Co-methyltransferase